MSPANDNPPMSRVVPIVPAPGPMAVPHTQVHALLRRTLENLQDVIAVALILLLFVLSLQALWRIARMAFAESAATSQSLSEVMYVLILVELYRLLIYYLGEHRVSVALAVEVALVSTLREVMIKGVREFEAPRLLGLSLLMVVLGALLYEERWRHAAIATRKASKATTGQLPPPEYPRGRG